jgi:hypothetical protein
VRRALALLATVALLAGAARAETVVQKGVPEVWPGRFQVGFHPFGVQVRFDGVSTGGYRMTADFAARVRDMEKFTVWVGGGLNYAHPSYSCAVTNLTGCGHDVQLWGFVMFTLEKLLKIPLVPFLRGGVAVDILPYPTASGSLTGGALSGGGVHYWLVQRVGLGAEMHFTFGPGFYPAAVIGGTGSTNASVYANWDFVLGARAAF